jgi:hypothetical protein
MERPSSPERILRPRPDRLNISTELKKNEMDQKLNKFIGKQPLKRETSTLSAKRPRTESGKSFADQEKLKILQALLEKRQNFIVPPPYKAKKAKVEGKPPSILVEVQQVPESKPSKLSAERSKEAQQFMKLKKLQESKKLQGEKEQKELDRIKV